MPCSDPIIALLEPFRPLFTAPTWKKMLVLLRGTLLARGSTAATQAASASASRRGVARTGTSPLPASIAVSASPTTTRTDASSPGASPMRSP